MPVTQDEEVIIEGFERQSTSLSLERGTPKEKLLVKAIAWPNKLCLSTSPDDTSDKRDLITFSKYFFSFKYFVKAIFSLLFSL